MLELVEIKSSDARNYFFVMPLSSLNCKDVSLNFSFARIRKHFSLTQNLSNILRQGTKRQTLGIILLQILCTLQPGKRDCSQKHSWRWVWILGFDAHNFTECLDFWQLNASFVISKILWGEGILRKLTKIWCT